MPEKQNEVYNLYNVTTLYVLEDSIDNLQTFILYS